MIIIIFWQMKIFELDVLEIIVIRLVIEVYAFSSFLRMNQTLGKYFLK